MGDIRNDDRREKSFTLHPSMETLAQLEAGIEEFMEEQGISVSQANKMNIAVDEIFSNIVSYSGADRAQVLCRIDAKEILVIFRDDGIPYDPLNQATPDLSKPLEERSVGGLGIFMTRRLMSEVAYDYLDGYNQMTLILERS